jgi:Recombination endonuclease VII
MAQGTCTIPGCGRYGRIRYRWCDKHYQIWRAHGDPLWSRPEPGLGGHDVSGHRLHDKECPGCHDILPMRTDQTHCSVGCALRGKPRLDARAGPGEKFCAGCQQALPIDRFGWVDKDHTRRKSRCKDCSRQGAVAWQRANPAKRDRNNLRMKAKLAGLDPDLVAARLDAHNAFCDICGCPPSQSDKYNNRLHVDHDHATGQFRGFLCGNCNRGLGMFKDDVRLLRQAAAYLGGTLF